jgi:DNA-binding transcriptional ArsR family regulator
VEENSYRQSRLCRLLGNPVAFAVVELLAENKELNPSEIARAVGRSVPRVSNVLGALRLADVVRYDSDGKRNYYRLKHPGEIRQVLTALSRFVKFAATVPAGHR